MSAHSLFFYFLYECLCNVTLNTSLNKDKQNSVKNLFSKLFFTKSMSIQAYLSLLSVTS